MSRSEYGIPGDTFSTEAIAGSRQQDIAAIERRLGDFTTAWNRHEPAQMASVWHDDGDLINPWGRVAKGREQVLALFREEHSGPMKTCNYQMTTTSLRLVSGDVAIVDCESTLTGMRDQSGKELPPYKPHILLLLSKKDGEWRVLCGRPYAFSSRPGGAS